MAKNEIVGTIKNRLAKSSTEIMLAPPDGKEIVYQHTILCQTTMPYKNPGDDVTHWERRQGNALLAVQAGKAFHPVTKKLTKVGLPYGPKSRLILSHLNTSAIKTNSPIVDVEGNMMAFIKRIGLGTDGRTVREVKEQLGRLSTALISLAFVNDDKGFQYDSKIISGFNLWFPKDENQRVLWPSNVILSTEYFESLTNHAVPLDERALGALSHSAMGLDIYMWLSQRLHRIEKGKPQFVPWASLYEQFGSGYSRLRRFREFFKGTIGQVLTQYKAAKIEEIPGKGLKLYKSPPPVLKNQITAPFLSKIRKKLST